MSESKIDRDKKENSRKIKDERARERESERWVEAGGCREFGGVIGDEESLQDSRFLLLRSGGGTGEQGGRKRMAYEGAPLERSIV